MITKNEALEIENQYSLKKRELINEFEKYEYKLFKLKHPIDLKLYTNVTEIKILKFVDNEAIRLTMNSSWTINHIVGLNTFNVVDLCILLEVLKDEENEIF